MSEVTQILNRIEQGDEAATAQLLPLVYEELRKLAAAKLGHEKPGLTLQATALVHEAYLRLVGAEATQQWNGRGHFFGAAAEAMRRILVDNARQRGALRRGGDMQRVPLSESDAIVDRPDELIALDEVLTRFEQRDPESAQLVKLRYFAGLTMQQAADAVGIPLRTAERNWTFARTWLHGELRKDGD
jgi:RNA polymerase sigma factor (TIGR02999 family)